MLHYSFFLSFLETKEEDNAAPEPGVAAVPWTMSHATTTSHTKKTVFCDTCISTSAGPQSPLNRRRSFLKSPESHSPTLEYESEDQERIVEEIVALGRTGVRDGPPLTFAFLLCLCVQYSSTCLHTSDLRRLLLLIASAVQSAMWVSGGEKDDVMGVVFSSSGSEL